MNNLRVLTSDELNRNEPEALPTEPAEALNGGGGGGTYGGMEAADREYVDLKLEAAMNRIDGKFDMLNQRLGDLEKRTPTWWGMLGAVMIGVGAILAALSLAGDHFSMGMNLAEQRQEQMELDRQQDQRFEEIIRRLDALAEPTALTVER